MFALMALWTQLSRLPDRATDRAGVVQKAKSAKNDRNHWAQPPLDMGEICVPYLLAPLVRRGSGTRPICLISGWRNGVPHFECLHFYPQHESKRRNWEKRESARGKEEKHNITDAAVIQQVCQCCLATEGANESTIMIIGRTAPHSGHRVQSSKARGRSEQRPMNVPSPLSTSSSSSCPPFGNFAPWLCQRDPNDTALHGRTDILTGGRGRGRCLD